MTKCDHCKQFGHRREQCKFKWVKKPIYGPVALAPREAILKNREICVFEAVRNLLLANWNQPIDFFVGKYTFYDEEECEMDDDLVGEDGEELYYVEPCPQCYKECEYQMTSPFATLALVRKETNEKILRVVNRQTRGPDGKEDYSLPYVDHATGYAAEGLRMCIVDSDIELFSPDYCDGSSNGRFECTFPHETDSKNLVIQPLENRRLYLKQSTCMQFCPECEDHFLKMLRYCLNWLLQGALQKLNTDVVGIITNYYIGCDNDAGRLS